MLYRIEAEYPDVVLKTLKQFFPDPECLNRLLPFFKWNWSHGSLKLYFVCRSQLNAAKFFFEMIHRWLLPGRRLDVSALFSTDFHFSDTPQTLFTMAEMTVRIDPLTPRDQMEHNLKVIETEIRLAVTSIHHASQLLESHFTTPQQKNSQIQEKIRLLLERNPSTIDFDIFGILQQLMVMSREEFKVHRSATHLSRVVAACYLFTKSIERGREEYPKQRQVRLKMKSVVLDLPWGPKEVLGICVGLNLLTQEELFDEKHLIRAVQNVLGNVKVVPGSFYLHEGVAKGLVVLYLEVEKGSLSSPSFPLSADFQFVRTYGNTEDQKVVSSHRTNFERLRKQLIDEVRKCVEVLPKSIFMPRNEEEILKYIVALAGQLRFVKDHPQVILMFDEQKGGELYFTVIVVRILFPTSYSIQYLFGQAETSLRLIPDRVKRVGLLRKKYPKEATVFRVVLLSHTFLREDQSVDLFRARQSVFQELEKVLGPLRDYTGGMLAKQVELIDEVQALMGEKDPRLELFFHALYPAEARSFLQPEQVKNWFMLWKQLLEFPEDPFKIERDQSCVYVMGLVVVMPELDVADFEEGQLIVAAPEQHEKYLGYLFITSDVEEQRSFIAKFQSILL
jgi:hypothetical protein